MTEKKDTYKKIAWLVLCIYSDILWIFLIIGGYLAFSQSKPYVLSLSLLFLGVFAMAMSLWSQASTNPFTGRMN